MYLEAKQIVEAHHKTPDDITRVMVLRQRLLNFPIRYSDLYALLKNAIMIRQFYFLPYFLSADFLRKLYNDVINWPTEKNLKFSSSGETLNEARIRVDKSGTLVEKQEVVKIFLKICVLISF